MFLQKALPLVLLLVIALTIKVLIASAQLVVNTALVAKANMELGLSAEDTQE